MICPHCGAWGAHPTIRTDPSLYFSDNISDDPGSTLYKEYFERFGGRDLSCRVRTKQCVACKTNFDTAETSKHYIVDLISSAYSGDRYEKWYYKEFKEHEELKAEVAKLKKTISSIRKAMRPAKEKKSVAKDTSKAS